MPFRGASTYLGFSAKPGDKPHRNSGYLIVDCHSSAMHRLIALFGALALISLHAAAPENIEGGSIYHETGRGVFSEEVGLGMILNADGTFAQIYVRSASPIPLGGGLPRLASPTDGRWTYTKLPDKPDTVPAGVLTLQYSGTGAKSNVVLDFLSDTGGVVFGSFSVGGNFTITPPTRYLLSNSSSRVSLNAGGVARNGFVLTGTAAQSVLVRAVGPGLASFGITNSLRNPALKVFSPTGAVVGENDDWGSESTAAINRLNTLAGAFPLPNASRDAVAFLRLPPGAYVVETRSPEPSDSGEVLIEVFMLP